MPQRDRVRDLRASGAEPLAPAAARLVRNRSREEITAAGFDPFRQLTVTGTGNDPLAAPASTGLFVPPAPLASAYRFLLAVADLDAGDMLVGIRQGMEIGAYLAETDEVTGQPVPPIYPLVRPVTTYNWHFVDAGWVWTLTREPRPSRFRTVGAFDRESFSFRDAGVSALVYASAAFPIAPVLPGYPGLTAYTPPALLGRKVLSIRDIRWPFDDSQSDEELWIPVQHPERWRLYCDVFQTDPATRNSPVLSTDTDVRQVTGLPAEEEFLQFCGGIAGEVAIQPIVWRAHGRLIVERNTRTA